jgi:hypothetical protein
MKQQRMSLLLLSIVCIVSCTLVAMHEGPMNAVWFCDNNHPFAGPNGVHQYGKWKNAEMQYAETLSFYNIGTNYDRDMATVNAAACQMAQRKETGCWGIFDVLIDIPSKQRLSYFTMDKIKSTQSILVETKKVGIGDIACFSKTIYELKKKTNARIIVSIRPSVKGTFSNVIKDYGCELISDNDEQPKTDYVTHIIGLLGHLRMEPAATKPDKFLLTAPDRAMLAVTKQLMPFLGQDKKLVAVFAGEDRQAILIGGRLLPFNTTDHGRHLSSDVFSSLLLDESDLVLIDCGTEKSRFTVSDNQRDHYMILAEEEQAFDTIVALAQIMNINERIVALLTDQGPGNVFIRALCAEAQKRAAFIIPNPEQYDMRMEGDGQEYVHMLSDCLVFKSQFSKLEDQIEVVKKALKKITAGK